MADTIDKVASLDELGVIAQRLENMGFVSAEDSDEWVEQGKRLKSFNDYLNSVKGADRQTTAYRGMVELYNKLSRERTSEGE